MKGGGRTTAAPRSSPVSPRDAADPHSATPAGANPDSDAPDRAAPDDPAPGGTPGAARPLGRSGLLGLAALGAAAAAVVAAGGTALGTPRRGLVAASLPTSWLADHPLGAPRVATAAAAVLVAAWIAVVALTARGRIGGKGLCGLSAVWAAPLAVGAPLLSADAYAYLADGRLLATGHDPYRVGPAALGAGSPWLAAVDPQWAHARAPYGPAALLLARAAAATGSVGAGIAVLVAVAVLAVAVSGWAVWSLAPARWRPTALALWLPAPPVLLHLVGGAHLDALMVALTVAALVALRRRRPILAVALASAATAVKAPAVVAVAVVALASVRPFSVEGLTRAAVRRVASRVTVAVGVYLAFGFAAGDPWRLASTVSGPARSRTFAAPTTLLTEAFGGHGRDIVRVAALVVAGLVTLRLLATSDRRPPAATAGWALLAIVIAGPVFYPWYLTWPLACLAPVVARTSGRWLVPLVALASLAALPGLAGLSAAGVGVVVLAVAVLAGGAWAAGRDIARQHT